MSTLPSKNIIISNVVTRAGQSLTLAEKRILFAGLAYLNGKNGMVTLRAEEYAELSKIDKDMAYRQLKSAVDNIFNRYVIFQVEEGKKIGTAKVRWIDGYKYFDGEGYVKFSFSQWIFPYLFELQQQFTKYQLSQACALRSVYSWRLLELFEQYRPTIEIVAKDDNGKTIVNKNGKPKTLRGKQGHGFLKISIEDFNHAMDTPQSYRTNFKDLRVKVIEPSIKELQAKDGWLIEVREIKKGRKIAMLEFTFQRDPQLDFFK